MKSGKENNLENKCLESSSMQGTETFCRSKLSGRCVMLPQWLPSVSLISDNTHEDPLFMTLF